MTARPKIRCAVLLAAAFLLCAAATGAKARELTIDQRVAARRAIEQVYWNHRIWPKENPGAKPPLSAVLSDAAIRARVEAELVTFTQLAASPGGPVTGGQLQAEINRMVRQTKAPQTLRELFAALNDDPFLIAECLARPILARRTAGTSLVDAIQSGPVDARPIAPPAQGYLAPAIPVGGCTNDTWAPTAGSEAPDSRNAHTAVWTGSEMIVWGGSHNSGSGPLDTGGRYDPATDSWIRCSLNSASGDHVPAARFQHTAVWTGTEMIIWGGFSGTSSLATGGRYNPATDTWTPCSLTSGSGANAPAARSDHTAVWTGSEMILWGGRNGAAYLNTGGRYDPATDTWAASSMNTASGAHVPAPRSNHTAVWTGAEMIVWGGYGADGFNTGGRYDPVTDSWAACSLTNASGANVPAPRSNHTAVWTGAEMIVWGAASVGGLGSGGRYNPATDSWAVSSLNTASGANVAAARSEHAAVWTGTEMIVWGGETDAGYSNTGGRYRPSTDSWVASSLTSGTGANVPAIGTRQTAVWTGSEMLVWGGTVDFVTGGGRYDPATDSWAASSLNRAAAPNVPPTAIGESAVWTGAELIVWGGFDNSNTGGRYDPATDSWTSPLLAAGAAPNTPAGRSDHTAIWTGTEMIVWGGFGVAGPVANGGRYNPTTDAWILSSLSAGSGTNTPEARHWHSAVWTRSEMIVWGGRGFGPNSLNDGGRYNPFTDSWAACSLTNASGANVPSGRPFHTAVWTGSEMIVWGGYDNATGFFATGGRYRPATDTWVASTLNAGGGANAATARYLHTAVWTGAEMIVWGGGGSIDFNAGGRFNPATDSWVASSLTAGTGANAPAPLSEHTAIWTGSEMIVWGGGGGSDVGGRYDPLSDTWLPSSLSTGSGTDVPGARTKHIAVWTDATDERMIVWGGYPITTSGGLYCARCTTTRTWFQDADGDGHGSPTATYSSCYAPEDYVASADDCNDADPAIHPGAVETCNAIDDDCDLVVDNGGDALCDDAFACTADACAAAGGCSSAPANLDTSGFSADRIDGRDLVVIALAWNSCPGDARYDAGANLDRIATPPGDCIDLTDFHLFMNTFGHSCS